MSESSTLTVLLPAYNTEQYIHEAIDSILNQTFTDFEFLIINDGSKDKTLDIIKSYSDPRIKVIDQPNLGLIDSLNKGIALAKGNIIARMDADDIALPDRIEHQLKFLQENPDYVLVGSESDVIDKDGNYLMKLIPRIGYTHEDISERIDEKCPFIHPTVMFRKDAALKAGGYPQNAILFEDHLLWKKMLSTGKVCNLHEVLLKVRFNPESVTTDEKWLGKEFRFMRRRSIENGFVSDADAVALKEIVSSKGFNKYKQASYYAMIGKKYLWDNPDSVKARTNFKSAIEYYPQNLTTYFLYLFSFFPQNFRVNFYKFIKTLNGNRI